MSSIKNEIIYVKQFGKRGRETSPTLFAAGLNEKTAWAASMNEIGIAASYEI